MIDPPEEIIMAKKQKEVRRICLYGGPGSGKTKLAGYLNYVLMDYDCDYVNEWIKAWAYEGKVPESLDQWLVFGAQTHMEDNLLRVDKRTGRPRVDVVITDSPLYMQCCYATMFKVPGVEYNLKKTDIVEEMYPSLNIFVERPNVYRNNGRYQDLKGAKKMDRLILRKLDEWKVPYHKVPVTDKEGIEELIRSHLGLTCDRQVNQGLK